MNSSTSASSRGKDIRVPPRDVTIESAAGFLTELANLKMDEPRAVDRIIEKYRSWLGGLGETVIKAAQNSESIPSSVGSKLMWMSLVGGIYARDIGFRRHAGPVIGFALTLQSAWRRRTSFEREMSLLYLAKDLFLWQGREPLFPPGFRGTLNEAIAMEKLRSEELGLVCRPKDDPLTAVLVHALRLADRMHFCENSGCPAPYFIAQRRSQRYCGEECAKPAQRAYKKAWWDEHGAEWRRSRRRKARK